jgi:hypothetical protein
MTRGAAQDATFSPLFAIIAADAFLRAILLTSCRYCPPAFSYCRFRLLPIIEMMPPRRRRRAFSFRCLIFRRYAIFITPHCHACHWLFAMLLMSRHFAIRLPFTPLRHFHYFIFAIHADFQR